MKPANEHLTRKRMLSVLAAFAFLTTVRAADERPAGIQIQADGVRLELVAEHPQLATPIGLDVDSAGRIWLISSHTHQRPAEYPGPEFDEILVFEPDGSRRVFFNATSQTMDLELGPDGWVYLAERSRILRIRDTTGDGVADHQECLFTLQTDAVYPHNGLSGLTWDLQGHLLFGLGENHAEGWTLIAADGTQLKGIGEGGIFRCQADAADVRQVARGLWNPFAICVRRDGEIFAVDNDPGERPPCRLLQIVDLADYGYRRLYGGDAHHPFVGWNGELRGTLPMIRPSGEAPCGIADLGQGLLVPSWSEHRIHYFPLKAQGAGYSADAVELLTGGRYFRPTCLAAVPDDCTSATVGRSDARSAPQTRTWYLTDWVDGRYDVHGFGRLWKLEIDLNADWVGSLQLPPPTQDNLDAAAIRQGQHALNEAQLLKLAGTKDPFLAQAAVVALARNASGWTADQFREFPPEFRRTAVIALKTATIAGDGLNRNITSPDRDVWLPLLLKDDDPDVRFEALRWISDARLTTYADDVDQLLAEPSLSFELFEAGLAAWNMLHGRPQDGLRNPEFLLKKVQDSNAAPDIRAFALRLLPISPMVAAQNGADQGTHFPDGLTLDLLRNLLTVGHAQLSHEVVQVLSGNPLQSSELLKMVAVDQSADSQLRANAVAGLAGAAEKHIDVLLDLATSPNRAVCEEALQSFAGISLDDQQISRLKQIRSSKPDSDDLFQLLFADDQTLRKLPSVEDTSAWLALLDAVPGDGNPAAGRRIFYHSRIGMCSRCHRHSGYGNVVGPDLTNVARQSHRTQLLQSILQPSRDMAPEFQASVVVLKDGRTMTGIRLRSWTRETLRDTSGRNLTFNLDDVEDIVPLRKSFMPDGIAQQLTMRELRDLLAFLTTDQQSR
ncbi:MAG: hypothetical protein R3C49_27820 [Planctomycetaceae bacterium]